MSLTCQKTWKDAGRQGLPHVVLAGRISKLSDSNGEIFAFSATDFTLAYDILGRDYINLDHLPGHQCHCIQEPWWCWIPIKFHLFGVEPACQPISVNWNEDQYHLVGRFLDTNNISVIHWTVINKQNFLTFRLSLHFQFKSNSKPRLIFGWVFEKWECWYY